MDFETKISVYAVEGLVFRESLVQVVELEASLPLRAAL